MHIAPPIGVYSQRSAVGLVRLLHNAADLDGSETVKHQHIAEALSYRRVMPGRGLN